MMLFQRLIPSVWLALLLLSVGAHGAEPAPGKPAEAKPGEYDATPDPIEAAPVEYIAKPAPDELTPVDLRVTSRVGPKPGHNAPDKVGWTDEPRRVEGKAADRGALASSLRYLESPLRQPDGFTDIYLVPGSGTRLMRSNGAVHAVFTDSEYHTFVRKIRDVQTNIHFPMGKLELSDIPAATIFYIGATPTEDQVAPRVARERSAPQSIIGSPELAQPDPIDPHAPVTPPSHHTRVLAMDEQALAQLDARCAGPHGEPAAPKSFLNHAGYRADRVRQLMRQAAQAARASAERSAAPAAAGGQADCIALQPQH
jgi:hypothetical protein